MEYVYKPTGTCSKAITVVLADDDTIENVSFLAGCPGNLIGIGRLVKGKKPEEIIPLLRGVTCGAKPTSCPDQLTYALEAALAEKKKQQA